MLALSELERIPSDTRSRRASVRIRVAVGGAGANIGSPGFSFTGEMLFPHGPRIMMDAVIIHTPSNASPRTSTVAHSS